MRVSVSVLTAAAGDDEGDGLDDALGTASEGVAVAAAGEGSVCGFAVRAGASRRVDFFLTVMVNGAVAR